MTLPEPASRKELYLAKAAGMDVPELPEPASRIEEYLNAIAESGGGGGGTSNFNQLTNRPSYNGTTMTGNTNIPEVPPKMVVLSYGTSTWQDFINAYRSNSVVYCRASSGTDPSQGEQTRLAFMAYVSNAANPTSVEFQYYRSMSNHSDTDQGDEVYVYKLTNTGTWEVTKRNAYTKIDTGGSLSKYYNNGTLTISNGDTITSDWDLTTNPTGALTIQPADNPNGTLSINPDSNGDLHLSWGDDYATMTVPSLAHAGGEVVKKLTSDDKNWPTNTPNGIALWKLDAGVYEIAPSTGSTITVYLSSGSSMGVRSPLLLLIGDGYLWNGNNVKQVLALNNPYSDGGRVYRYEVSENASYSKHLLDVDDVTDHLTSTSAVKPLSANQGKVLNDKIGDLSALTTTNKSSIVAAINELAARL